MKAHLEPIIQPAAIDVAAWHLDDLFSNYPEGARSKNAFFPPEPVPFAFIKVGRRYMFKKSVKRYPDQYWGEVVAYQVGTMLGVTVPPSYAAFNSETGQSGALIEWFYEDGQASLVSGGNYMQKLYPEYDRKKGAEHNFRWVQAIGRLMARAKIAHEDHDKYWAEAFLFDALIGNTDRHQDNWGYVFTKTEENLQYAFLSPLFDNGTSLGHERFMDAVKTWQDQDYERYIARGTHHMKWDKDDNKKCGHIEMVLRLAQVSHELKAHLFSLVSNFPMEALASKLGHLKTLDIPVPLSDERAEMYLKLISLRKRKLELALS